MAGLRLCILIYCISRAHVMKLTRNTALQLATYPEIANPMPDGCSAQRAAPALQATRPSRRWMRQGPSACSRRSGAVHQGYMARSHSTPSSGAGADWQLPCHRLALMDERCESPPCSPNTQHPQLATPSWSASFCRHLARAAHIRLRLPHKPSHLAGRGLLQGPKACSQL